MKPIERVIAAVVRRRRLADAAWGLSRLALPIGMVVWALCNLAIRYCLAGNEVLWLVALPVPLVLVWAFARRHPKRKVARDIDAHYGTHDLLGSALELSKGFEVKQVEGRAGDIVGLLVAEASARAATLDPRPVVKLSVAKPRWWDGLALATLVASGVAPLPYQPYMCETEPAVVYEDPVPIVIMADPGVGGASPVDMPEAGPLRDNLRDLAKGDDGDLAAKLAEQMLEILDQLERGELDRAAALEELQRLEEELANAESEYEAGLEEDPGTLADGLREMAEAFEQQELTEEVAAALSKQDGEEAEKALNEAGDAADENGGQDEKSLQKALEEAERRLEKAAERANKTAKELDEEERRLRREQKKKPKDPKEQAEHERRLKKQKERVEQLRRQHEREQAAQDKLEKLRRDANKAGQRGGKNAEQKRKSLQKLSRGMKQAAQAARKARRMGQARDAMQEAKSVVRRAGNQGEGAKRRKQQFKRFSQAAKGQKGKDGKGKDGKDGKGEQGIMSDADGKGGKKGQPTLMIEGDVGDGEPDMMMEGDQGGQQGEGEGEGEGQGEGDGEGEGQGNGQDPGQGGQPSQGDGIGQGSADPLGDDPTGLNTNKKNVRVKAREGKGATRAEVIRDASQQGFASEAYRRVFQDYRGFAQSALDSEALPAAQRRRVKRYYQLIMPRE